MSDILSLEEALSLLKEGYSPKVKKIWMDFVSFCECSFDDSAPKEDSFLKYFKFLREDKKLASSSLWSYYSLLNTVMKNRYNTPLQQYPRITTLLKSFSDIKKKASIFEYDELKTFVLHDNSTPYWIVRKVIVK